MSDHSYVTVFECPDAEKKNRFHDLNTDLKAHEIINLIRNGKSLIAELELCIADLEAARDVMAQALREYADPLYWINVGSVDSDLGPEGAEDALTDPAVVKVLPK